ncbi:MAG: putative DNA binding domain-containing protein [Prevotellaceae bacterium]|jgi:ATP-dependent DNA helicase RecG|nr:putative DNA binding domain-containing protein [Prevotellaceae bacterium]
MKNNDLIIKNLLQMSDNERIELKPTASLEEIAETLTAFINSHGGDLLLGADEHKTVVGVQGDGLARVDIQNYLSKAIIPSAPISISEFLYQGKRLLLISAWEGSKKPYSYQQKFYIRRNGQTAVANERIIEQLISNRKDADFHWERMAVLGAELNDLDLPEIRKTMDMDLEMYPQKSYADAEDFLIKNGLMLNGNLTNACIVLFGKNPTRYISQSKVRLTVYPGKASSNTFLEDRWFDSNLLANIPAIFSYLDALYGKTIKIGGLLRSEKKNYPEIALREGILNAMIHRDYNSVRGFMQISIYSNRTEISNFGGLPEGISIAELKKKHHSILRNPDIAYICFIRRLIEMVGTGSNRILSECKKKGFKQPKWQEENNILTLTFPEIVHSKNERIDEPIDEQMDERINERTNTYEFDYENEFIPLIASEPMAEWIRRERKNEQINEQGERINERINEQGERINERINEQSERINEQGERINERIKLDFGGVNESASEGIKRELSRIYDFISDKPMSKTADIELLTKKSNATIRRYLKILTDNNLIVYVGSRKTGGYKIAHSPQNPK